LTFAQPRRGKVSFMSLAEINTAVDGPSPEEFAELSAFIRDRDEDARNTQFEEDVVAGKLDHLAKKADADFEVGR